MEESTSAAKKPEEEPTLPPDERNKPEEVKGYEFKFIPMSDPRVFPNFTTKET